VSVTVEDTAACGVMLPLLGYVSIESDRVCGTETASRLLNPQLV
jgi:hypothetical protein